MPAVPDASAPRPTAQAEPGSRATVPDEVPPLPAAVLWDMDGTLVDTEPSWLAAEAALVEEFGGRWTPQDAVQMVGLPLIRAAEVLRAHGVPLSAEVIVERLLDGVVAAVEEHTLWQPGARELLAGLRDAGVPCALVTMSYRRLVDAVLRDAPGEPFSVIVTGDEVENGKPHPEPYLRAAERLGVDAQQCVAIEDSPPGIGSALAAGARTLGVQHIVPVQPRPGLSRADSLTQITVEDLSRMVAGEVFDRLTAAEDRRH